ncbi:MAG: glycosyltransferase family 2 protein [Candidatus Altiarchaeota archaeon]|nr:glycosyltransferase family 2 protein [Candidatus Altiarchaeota archaeon]
MKLSVVMPAYNESETIADAIKMVLDIDYGMDLEVLVVDDGSTDNTLEIMKGISSKNKKVKSFSNVKNKGKGYSIRYGMEKASGDFVVIQDADLEYDPVQIRDLLKPLVEGQASVVYGSRFMGESKNQSMLFYVGNKILNLCFNALFFTRLTDVETCYKLASADVFRSLKLSSDGFEIEGEISAKLVKNGHKILELPIKYFAREKEKKKINVWDGVKTAATMIKLRLNLL